MMICVLIGQDRLFLGKAEWCYSCKELWDGIISFLLAKDGLGYPMLNGIRKEALRPLSLAFRIQVALIIAAT